MMDSVQQELFNITGIPYLNNDECAFLLDQLSISGYIPDYYIYVWFIIGLGSGFILWWWFS